MEFTIEEENLVSIFETGSRKNLIKILRETLKNDIYDLELRDIYENTIAKIQIIYPIYLNC